MTAAQYQIREELFWRLKNRLGIDCRRDQIAVYSDRTDVVMSFRISHTFTVIQFPWSKVRDRHVYQDEFEISVLNGLLQDAIAT